jgi:hypothetical protein
VLSDNREYTEFDNVTDIIKKTIEAEEETKRVISEGQTKRAVAIAEEDTKLVIAEGETKRAMATAEEQTKRRLAEEETKRVLAEQQTQRLAADADAYRVESEAEVKRATAVADADVKRIQAEVSKLQAEKEKLHAERASSTPNDTDVNRKRNLETKLTDNTKRAKVYTREKAMYRNRGKTFQNLSKLVLDHWLKEQTQSEPVDDHCMVTVYKLVYDWFCAQEDVTKLTMSLQSMLVNETEVFRVLAIPAPKANAFTGEQAVLTYVLNQMTTSQGAKDNVNVEAEAPPRNPAMRTEVQVTATQQVLDLQCVLQGVDNVSGWYNTDTIRPVAFRIPKVAEKDRIVRNWLNSISTVTEKANNSFGWKVISIAMMLPDWRNDWVRTATQRGTLFTFYDPEAVPCLYRAVLVNRNIIKKTEVAELIRQYRHSAQADTMPTV